MHYTILSPKSYKAISESIRNFIGYRQRVFYEMLPFVIITEALYSHTVSKSILNSHTNKIEEMCQKRNNVKMLSISTPATTIVSNITLVSEVNCWKLCRVCTNPANMQFFPAPKSDFRNKNCEEHGMCTEISKRSKIWWRNLHRQRVWIVFKHEKFRKFYYPPLEWSL